MTMDVVADYRLLGPAGTGSTGAFYVAVPPVRLGLDVERVIVKVVDGVADQATFEKVSRELRIFASVASPHLVRLFDAGQDGDRFYYSMEYLPLGTLAAPARPLARHEVIRAVFHAALAAHDLHEAGLAHRDIHPATVLLHEGGAKLADLGLAQTINPDRTVTGLTGLESVEYVDPALLRGGRAVRSGDVFALGATLHRVLSGEGLYGYLPPNEPLLAVRRVLSTDPTPSSALSEQERGVIDRCIAADLDARYRTARELADALEPLIDAAGTGG